MLLLEQAVDTQSHAKMKSIFESHIIKPVIWCFLPNKHKSTKDLRESTNLNRELSQVRGAFLQQQIQELLCTLGSSWFLSLPRGRTWVCTRPALPTPLPLRFYTKGKELRAREPRFDLFSRLLYLSSWGSAPQHAPVQKRHLH